MIPGVKVGHWTDGRAMTGCTVVLFPEGTVASGEVRGGAPATREFELLLPGRLVNQLDAVVLAGGSAYGLAAADGVMRWCESQGRGFATVAGVIPIVVAMSIFDLSVGDSNVRPGADEGAEACALAREGRPVTGRVGAGTGATVGKWRGPEAARPGGVGFATESDGDLLVAALAVVNAYGDVHGDAAFGAPNPMAWPRPPAGPTSTTIGVIVTNASLDKSACLAVAQGGHDGLARAVHPPHTSYDGDAIVAAATGPLVGVHADQVRAMAVDAFSSAIRNAVTAGCA